MNPFVWYIAEYKLLTFKSITMELVKLHKQRRDLQGGEGECLKIINKEAKLQFQSELQKEFYFSSCS